jgi:hypothetical protein
MRRWALRALAATSAMVAVLLAVVVNVATATFPSFLDHHPGRAWTLVAVLGLVSVACAVLGVRAGEPSGRGSPAGGVRVGGISAGRDLNVRGRGHTLVGGDQVTTTSRQDPSGEPKRRRRR